jgi:hypothetical protein
VKFVVCERATSALAGLLDQSGAGVFRGGAAGRHTAAFISGHIFRATGVIADLKNGGTLEKAARMVNHASARST